MADSEWGGLEPKFVTKLRETKVEPVPEPIVKLAQRSLKGQPHPNDPELIQHAMQLEFDTPAKAAAFARHMKNAGAHTTPPSSVTVVVDPERQKVQAKHPETGKPLFHPKTGKPIMTDGEPVNPKLVAWRAGARRGRAAA